MYFFGLNIKNILLLKLFYLIFSSIIPSQLIYGYELCEIKEECFNNEKFKKEISLKKNLRYSKNFDNFFNKRIFFIFNPKKYMNIYFLNIFLIIYCNALY